ncbi:SDR family oxidoreductase [Pedobacter sp. Leaf194]|uniref:SDR family oxidoreductase n=1 Tax=Pedobacter sp. Leaf194 TaxID=1736297 RepID=UPI00070351BA|nr:SDR family oxidoreductase [Pedobacter sp. Leaf194]KQS35637.1 NAD(P)-dependent oxidoreductase [Pedobacter sp. Leaf194]
MIIVTGATGQFGSKTIDHLLKKGAEPSTISALVRDVKKAKRLADTGITLKAGDYNDHESLISAFKGVDKLLLVSSNDKEAFGNRTSQHLNVINAAKEAQVKQIIYTSFIRKPHFEDSAIAAFQNSHVQTEEALKASGINYTILQNGIYLEMIPIFVGDKVAETGTIMFPAQAGKASFVLREELAEAAAHVLLTESHENKVYQLTNTEAVTFDDIADALSIQLAKGVKYHSPTLNEFEMLLRKLGIPDLYIGMFTMWGTAVAQGTMDLEDNTLQTFLERKPTSMIQFINQTYG